MTPTIHTDTNEGTGDFIVYNDVKYVKFSALTSDEQQFVIEERLRIQNQQDDLKTIAEENAKLKEAFLSTALSTGLGTFLFR